MSTYTFAHIHVWVFVEHTHEYACVIWLANGIHVLIYKCIPVYSCPRCLHFASWGKGGLLVNTAMAVVLGVCLPLRHRTCRRGTAVWQWRAFGWSNPGCGWRLRTVRMTFLLLQYWQQSTDHEQWSVAGGQQLYKLHWSSLIKWLSVKGPC